MPDLLSTINQSWPGIWFWFDSLILVWCLLVGFVLIWWSSDWKYRQVPWFQWISQAFHENICKEFRAPSLSFLSTLFISWFILVCLPRRKCQYTLSFLMSKVKPQDRILNSNLVWQRNSQQKKWIFIYILIRNLVFLVVILPHSR